MSETTTAPMRVRFPPSPTGYLHVGGARSALFNWLAARQSGGTFILRIEDTDRTRLNEDSVRAITEGLRWLGLQWDEGPEVGGPYGPYIQSERIALYQEQGRALLASGHAYEDFSPPRVQGRQTAQATDDFRRFRDLTPGERHALRAEYTAQHAAMPAVRLKVPLAGETVAQDLIRGEIRWRNTEIPTDPVLLKGDGYPTYHLAVVVDDYCMCVSHVMRADEWIPSLPIHAILYDAFGWQRPVWCHLPLVTRTDGKKFSKRHGDSALHEYQEQGYLPEAMVNFCALLGWSFGDDIELFTKEEAAERFRIADIRPAPSAWDTDKLRWMNGQWINHRLTVADFAARALPFLHAAGITTADFPEEYIVRALATVKDKPKLLSEVPDLTRFYFEEPEAGPEMAALLTKQGGAQARGILDAILTAIADADWSDRERLVAALDAVVAQYGVKRGVPFGLARIATTGRTAAPDQASLMLVLGRGRVERRLHAALAALGNPSPPSP